MTMRHRQMAFAIGALLVAVPVVGTLGQSRRIDDSTLRKAAQSGDEWLTYGRDQAETRFSPLTDIDATNVGYNVEWSQELRLEESLREYVAGSMLVDMAREEGLLGRPTDPARDATIFDMSEGYDLEGIRSFPVRSWIESMKDARVHVDALRRRIAHNLSDR